MESIEPTVVHQKGTKSKARHNLRWVEKVSRLMDSKYVIPGTNIRFGLDPILSLFPVLGDLAASAISGLLIYTMHQHGASRKLVILMVINATLDFLIGSIPVIGSIFTIFFRANDRNVRLLKEHYEEGKHKGSGKGLLIVVAIALLVLVVAVLYILWKILEAIFEFLF